MTTFSPSHPVADSISVFSSLPGWLAAPVDGQRVGESLIQHVPELAAGQLTLVSCSPQRLRAKERKWLARYQLTLARPGLPAQDHILVGNLFAPSEQPSSPPSDGSSWESPAWVCWLPDLGLELRRERSDDALPGLPMLLDPEISSGLLQPILRAAGYARATIASCDPVVVRYKPGSRCTVLVHLTYTSHGEPAPPTSVVLKTHHGEKGHTAWAAMKELWQRPSWRGALELAEPLAYLADQRVLVQGPVPGALTLKELARRAFVKSSPDMIDALRTELATTGRALAALHDSGAVFRQATTLDDEVAEMRGVVERLAFTIPVLAGAADPLLQQVAAMAARHPADPLVPAHHDFRPAQVMLHQGSVGFIDFDGAAMAEPALDLGRFRAKLRDIGISSLIYSGQPLSGSPLVNNLALLDDLCEHFLDAYQAHRPVTRERVLLWETCDLMTGVLHAWTKVRLARLEPRLTILLHQLRGSGLPESPPA